ncbi:MAG: hypothetical protein Q4Q53_01440 [Methanocorpusculum sp.]|nr:hypothetical protein [Methanocorpusculum sp.]
MVVPCLTCKSLDKYEYVFNKETTFYEYHISCKKGVELPCPMVKDGFECKKYENKFADRPKAKRGMNVIELKQD